MGTFVRGGCLLCTCACEHKNTHDWDAKPSTAMQSDTMHGESLQSKALKQKAQADLGNVERDNAMPNTPKTCNAKLVRAMERDTIQCKGT